MESTPGFKRYVDKKYLYNQLLHGQGVVHWTSFENITVIIKSLKHIQYIHLLHDFQKANEQF